MKKFLLNLLVCVIGTFVGECIYYLLKDECPNCPKWEDEFE